MPKSRGKRKEKPAERFSSSGMIKAVKMLPAAGAGPESDCPMGRRRSKSVSGRGPSILSLFQEPPGCG